MVLYDAHNATTVAVAARDLSAVRMQRQILLGIISGLCECKQSAATFVFWNIY